MDHSAILALRRLQRQDRAAHLAPPHTLPQWPTLPQTGVFASWGDNTLANLARGAAMVMWDWPSRTVEEAHMWPEALPVLP